MTRTLLVVEQLGRRVPGGIGTYARGLVRGLAQLPAEERAGASEVTLLSSTAAHPLDAGRADGAKTEAFGIDLPWRRVLIPSPLLTRAWDHGIIRARSGFEVVHGTSFAMPRAPRAATTVMVHDLSWRRYPETTTPRGRRWHERGLRRTLHDAARVVVPSRAVGDQLREAGVSEDLVRVVPHGCDHLPAPDRTEARHLLRSHGIEGPFVLSVGTLEPRKNLGRLLAAHAAAITSLPERVSLVVVGPKGWGAAVGPAQGVPDGALGAAGARTAHAVALGAVSGPALAALYEQARAFLYVPLDEGFGFPPLEAARAGTPVVVSTAVPSMDPGPGAPPVAERVDALDVGAIAEAIVRVLTDEAHARALAASAGAHARGRTWVACARAHVSLWDEVARTGRTGRDGAG